MLEWIPRTADEVLGWQPLRIAFLVVTALLLRAVLVRIIGAAVNRIGSAPGRGGAGEARRQQRILALGAMGRSAVSAVIGLFVVCMVLAELGFNVSTLIAGTSIVAATVAFGLQNLIKDLVAGIAMLAEDQIGVGDFVDLDEASGVVEEIGLRVTTLRDENGNVWYVRNGEVTRVGNFSQGGTGRPVVVPQPVQRIRFLDEQEAAAPAPGARLDRSGPVPTPNPSRSTGATRFRRG